MIDNAWFNGILERHFSTTVYPRDHQSVKSADNDKVVDNSKLISNKLEVYHNTNEDKQNIDPKKSMYTGTVLNDSIKLNADYTIVNKEMFEYIIQVLGYKCSNTIIR